MSIKPTLFTSFITLGFFQNFSPCVHAETTDDILKMDSLQVTPSSIHLEKLHHATTLVIGCVDFRLIDETESLLRDKLHLQDDYDQVNLPGASLAFVEKKYPNWGQTIEEVIGLLKDLHQVKRVIFLDHMKCGAYKLIQGEKVMETNESEIKAHKESFKMARKKMNDKFPTLEVHTLLMDLNGKVDIINE